MINPFTTVKDYVMIALIVAAVGWGGVQTVRLNSAEKGTEKVQSVLNQERATRATQDLQRAAVALKDTQETADRERAHATEQTRKFNEYESRIKQANVQRDVAIANGQRLRKSYSDYVARPTGSDAKDSVVGTTCKLQIDRLEVLGQLAGESSQLLKEGESIVRQRNAEIELLKGIIENDRKALEVVGKESSL